ncbi:hypothetical protein M422DRAFT_81460, partial [Sphaerobolus stellatus SS14]
ISMACLNLPLDICFKAENMYIAGIIPGPEELHKTELNHYFRPLIDDLVVSYMTGVQFTKTANSAVGRLSRSAVVTSVNDLPAARKASQLGWYTSHFYCTVCSAFHLSTLGNTDYHNWRSKDKNILRTQALAWRDALTLEARKHVWDTYAVRWSELWRFPYWDPSKQLVVDPMHCLYEGLVHKHVRHLL